MGSVTGTTKGGGIRGSSTGGKKKGKHMAGFSLLLFFFLFFGKATPRSWLETIGDIERKQNFVISRGANLSEGILTPMPLGGDAI